LFRSGICLLDLRNHRAEVDEILFEVRFRQLNRDQIERYLLKDQPYGCAGSIRSEALGIVLFETMRGDDPTALMGLPLIRLTGMLRQAGLELP
jgi:septum formation protein